MWCEFLRRNNFLISLYPDMPELKNVRISEINMQDEGQIVAISFDMPVYTERPPKKWKDLGDNTVGVRVDLSAVKEISLAASSFDYKGDIEIFKDESELIVVKITGTVNALIKAEYGFVQSVTAYMKE
ncbi:Imm50 family immunity protein [Bacillus massilinigeriensis]|uniref:Imm50 family immunity protein n=1 Tax=Bacillus mediterraneensis TaxID=1805474 RepID=UPI0008F7E8CE|nr:Imm50 family immunity protein [Bacillus mediterraneensis]